MNIINIGTKKESEDYKFREVCYGIVESDGKILVVYSNKDKDYSLPGGGIENGESIEAGLKREFLEESGYEIENATHFVDANCFGKNSRGEYVNRFAHYFIVKINAKTKRIPAEDWHEVMWVEKDKIFNVLSHRFQIEVLKKCNICWKSKNLG